MVVKRQIIVGILLIAAASTFFLWGDSGTPVTAPIILMAVGLALIISSRRGR